MYTEFGGGLLETYALQVVGSERRCIHAIQYVYQTIVSFSQTCHSNKARVAERRQATQHMQCEHMTTSAGKGEWKLTN